MSVMIAGMDMPQCCIECPIYNHEFGCCNLIPNSNFYSDGENYNLFTDRYKDCPLREVKEAENEDSN